MGYQPFDGKEGDCRDCKERYEAIRADYGDLWGVWVVDFFAAESYFGFRMEVEGADRVDAVEIDEGVNKKVNDLAIGLGKEHRIRSSSKLPDRKYDIGLLLDSYGYSDTARYMDFIKDNCKVGYISAPDKVTEKLMVGVLKEQFSKVKPIYEGRTTIYRCES